MSVDKVEQAKRDVVRAKARLDSTLVAVQHRLRPGNLAGEAWDGVKEKSGDLADGALQAVKNRPAAVSLAIGALALFLAREPLKRAVTQMLSDGDEEEDPAPAGIDRKVGKRSASAQVAAAPVKEGVS